MWPAFAWGAEAMRMTSRICSGFEMLGAAGTLQSAQLLLAPKHKPPKHTYNRRAPLRALLALPFAGVLPGIGQCIGHPRHLGLQRVGKRRGAHHAALSLVQRRRQTRERGIVATSSAIGLHLLRLSRRNGHSMDRRGWEMGWSGGRSSRGGGRLLQPALVGGG